MTTDTPDDTYREFTEAIRKFLEEVVQKGGIPPAGFSITFTDAGTPEGAGGGSQPSTPRPAREPETEIFDTPGTRYITTELPGIDHEDIRFAVDGSKLHIAADGQEMMFRKTIPLDGVDPDTLRYTFRNGILEFSLRNICRDA